MMFACGGISASSDDMSFTRDQMWMVLGFGALGFLIGNIVGLSATSVVTQLISFLFALVGGSLLAFLHKLNEKDRRLAGAALLSLSLAAVAGMYLGVLVTEYRLLSPTQNIKAAVEGRSFYVRSAAMDAATAIDFKKGSGQLSAEEAYSRIFRLALTCEEKAEEQK
jgi:hypothetical protein